MSFMHPLLLLASLGVALPIIAHLINRHRVEHTDWAAMQFLNRSVRVRSRQLRLRDILLLILRCLAILCLAFAIARPFTDKTDGSWLPGENRAGVVIAVDASYSMAHGNGGASRFDRAMEQVGVISDHIQPGDPVSLVLLGSEHRVILRNVAFNQQSFAEAMKPLTATPESLDIDSVPKQLQGLVEDMDALQKEIFILTDAQAQNWEKISTQLRDSLKGLGEQASVFMVPVTGGDENLAVTGLDLVSGELLRGSVARYRATIKNYGSNPTSSVDVKCRIDGVQIDRKTIPVIAPSASETVSLFVPFYNAGSKRITAEIEGDSLSTDNVRRVVAVVRDKVSVLCLDGSSGDAGRLIRAALMARADGSEDENYVVRTVRWPSFPSREMDQADVVILTDVPEITKEQAEQLKRLVRRGSGLVWFAGDQIKIDTWNKLSGSGPDSLLPAVLGLPIDTSDSLGVGKPLDPSMPDHAVCLPLQSLPEDLLSETRLLKRLAVEPANSSFSLLNLAGSHSPVLLEHSLGRGHVFMFTTSAQASWNNMALTPVFPMLLQQIVTYLAGREFEQPRIVGDPLSLTYVDQPDATDAVFDTPSDQTITVPVREHRSQYAALLEKSREAGFYIARVSVQAPGLPIAVNVDTRESDVTCLSEAELEESLNGTGITVSGTEADLASNIEAARTGKSSWRYFIILGLGFLIVESLLADRILRRSRSTPAKAGPTSQPVEVA